MRKFEPVEHTADAGIRAFGNSPAELFANAAEGMFSLVTDIKQYSDKEYFTVSVKGSGFEQLMVNWLGELLYHFDIKKIIPVSYDIKNISDSIIEADIHGEKHDEKKHSIEHEVKAVTYHGLEIKQGKYWEAKILFDI